MPPAEQRQMFLNVDMAVDWDISVNAAGEESSCPMNNRGQGPPNQGGGTAGCPHQAATTGHVTSYEADNALFIDDFALAFVKMVKVQVAGQSAEFESLAWSDAPSESSCTILVQDCRFPPDNGGDPQRVGGTATFEAWDTPAPSAAQVEVAEEAAAADADEGDSTTAEGSAESPSVTEADAAAAQAAGGTGTAITQTVVSFRTGLNMALEAFSDEKRASYIKGVAATTGQPEADCSIVSATEISTRRRTLLAVTIEVETEVKVDDSVKNMVKNSVTVEALKSSLAASGIEVGSVSAPKTIVRSVTTLKGESSAAFRAPPSHLLLTWGVAAVAVTLALARQI